MNDRTAESGGLSRGLFYRKALEERLPLCIIVSRPGAGAPEYIGGTLLQEYGYRREDLNKLLQRGLEGFIHPGDRKAALETARRFQQDNAPSFQQEYRVLRQDGSVAWVTERSVLIEDDDGRPAYMSTLSDVTRQMEALERLRLGEEESRLAMEHMEKLISQYDAAAHQRARQTEQLRENERIMRAVAEHSGRIVYHYDLSTRTARSLNGELSRENGLPEVFPDPPAYLMSKHRVAPDSGEAIEAFFKAILAGEAQGKTKLHMEGEDGLTRWFDLRFSSINQSKDGPGEAVLSFLDVTARHEHELAFARYQQTIRESNAADHIFFESDLTADLIKVQGGAMLPLEMDLKETSYTDSMKYLIDRFFSEEVKARAKVYFSREHLLTLHADGASDVAEDWPIRLSGGKPGWIRISLQFVVDPYTEHTRAFLTACDITEEKTLQQHIQLRAETDGLTGVYNRGTTEELIRSRLAGEEGLRCVLLLSDLDDLKQLNDNLGHGQGDRALKAVADTLKSYFRASDIVGRIGG
ncbi:MAG: diguanylate cyclase, partial [Bacillota bacterium]|nr:diguanylate cyclase [Bacillota bacterium]